MTTTLTAQAPTATSHQGITSREAPTLYAKGEHAGHTVEVWEQQCRQVYPPDKWHAEERTHDYRRTQVLIDGKPAGDAPAGTPAQVLRKLAAKIDEAAEDDRLRPRLVELVDNQTRGGSSFDLYGVEAPPAVDDVVHVYAMGYMRRGLVVKVSKTRATVAYTTASSGGRIYRKVAPFDDLRRPAG